MSYEIGINIDAEDPDQPYLVSSPADLDPWFDHMTMATGDSGHWCAAQIGPAGTAPVLLFGLDSQVVDEEVFIRGMIRWLPTGQYGCGPATPAADSDVVLDGLYLSAMGDIVAYEPDATQVTGQHVMDAVREYVQTGQQPARLQWQSGHEHTITGPAPDQLTPVWLRYAFEDIEGSRHPTTVSDLDELDLHLDDLETTNNPRGMHVLAEIGPVDQPAVMQFGIDGNGPRSAGRAVLRWLPTGEYGHNPHVTRPDSDVSFDAELITTASEALVFNPDATRVTIEDVKTAVREYCMSGSKPGSLEWAPGTAATCRPRVQS
ncbi:MAG: Imm1 family immunity protein [Actinocatenispora sp.]